MCGIAGFLASSITQADGVATLGQMVTSIGHRGPDARGSWADPEFGLYLGHCRLAIVDLSATGAQPMLSASGRYVLSFNGEIYNHSELRRTLERNGTAPSWRGHSDTEVMLASIEAEGLEAALHAFVGMFAFAMWDRKTKTLTLARDRLGEKPLYYGWCGRTFLFASELSALAKHPSWHGRIDRSALVQFMRYNNVPGPRSIFEGISKLPPGSYLRVAADASEATPHAYWSAADVARRGDQDPFEGSADEAVDEIERLIRQSLQGQLMADVPVGTFLSGGIDSTTVVALATEVSSQKVKTYTIGSDVTDYDEAPVAREIAAYLGTEHAEFYVGEREAIEVVPRLAKMYSEPFADSSQIPTALVCAMARQHVTVALSGDGGDEIFSGYNRYALAESWEHRIARVPLALRRAARSFVTSVPPVRLDRIAQVLRSVASRRIPSRAGDNLHKLANVLPLDSSESVYRALVSHWSEPASLVIGGLEPADASLPQAPTLTRSFMRRDLVGYLPNDILVKVDRAAMANSLETRAPFLDHRLIEFAERLPMSILRHGGLSKSPLRCILKRRLPPSLFGRPKTGFGIPLDRWLRGPLRDWAEAMLDERRLKSEGYLEPNAIRSAWQDHLSGRRNLQYNLWNIVVFQSWLETARTGNGSTGI